MKIRNGFVSNSSSSSFIIAIPTEVKTKKQLKKLLFGELEYVSHPFERKALDSTEVAEIVFKDIKKSGSKNFEQVEEEIRENMWNLNHDYTIKYGTPEYKKEEKEWILKRCKMSKEKAEIFMKENEGKNIFIVEYSDTNGEFMSAVGHGNIFESIPHIRINKH